VVSIELNSFSHSQAPAERPVYRNAAKGRTEKQLVTDLTQHIGEAVEFLDTKWPTKVYEAHSTLDSWRACGFNQARDMSQTHPLTTTTFELPGYRVVKSFGVVRGIIVRSRSVVGNFGAHLQSLFGGNITLYTSLCERARMDAFNEMLLHAGQLGANAVVGVRYDATEIAVGITEVLCYGTAVYVEQERT